MFDILGFRQERLTCPMVNNREVWKVRGLSLVREQTPLRPYFEEMASIGKPLSEAEMRRTEDNVKFIKEQEELVAAAVEKIKNSGTPADVIHKRGQMTAYDRLEYLVDPVPYIPCTIRPATRRGVQE